MALPLGKLADNCPLSARREHDQAIAVRCELFKRDVRWLFNRTIKMCCGNKPAEIVIPNFVLRIERQPVIGRWYAVGPIGPRNAQQAANDRLHPGGSAGIGKWHRAVKPVAVNNGCRRKAKQLGALGNIFGVNRAFEHRVSGENPQRDKGGVCHN